MKWRCLRLISTVLWDTTVLLGRSSPTSTLVKLEHMELKPGKGLLGDARGLLGNTRGLLGNTKGLLGKTNTERLLFY